MKIETAVAVEQVSKKYCKSLKRSMLYGISDIARNTLGLSSKPHHLRKNEFWAVEDVSFNLKRGETFGLIGPNGSGKTTLLKMINGIFWPDKGKITVRGRVGALIEVGAGFHPLLTGRDNIYINAAILGMTRKEVDARFEEIVDFSGIGEFLDVPVKCYSSGMFVRLGFSIAVHCQPDILLVDEVLAVGDAAFRQKCYGKINELVNRGVVLVIVSHHLMYMKQYTRKAMLLNRGRCEFSGDTTQACNIYLESLRIKDDSRDSISISDTLYGTMVEDSPHLRDVEFRLCDKTGLPVSEVLAGEEATFHFSFHYSGRGDQLEISIVLYSAEGLYVTAMSTLLDEIDLKGVGGDISGLLKVEGLYLSPEEYVAVFSIKTRQEFLFRGHDIRLKVIPDKIHFGVVDLPREWDICGRKYSVKGCHTEEISE